MRLTDRFDETDITLAEPSFVLELDYDAPEINTLKFPEEEFVKEVPPKIHKLMNYKLNSYNAKSTNLLPDVAEVDFALTYGADRQEQNLSSILLVYLPHPPPYICYTGINPGFLVNFLRSATAMGVSSFMLYVYVTTSKGTLGGCLNIRIGVIKIIKNCS